MRKILRMLPLLIMCAITAMGQQTRITGIITDEGTRYPLPGVTVSLNEFSTVTDQGGIFILDGVPEGKWIVELSRDGYDATRVSVQIGKDPVDLGRITMRTYTGETQSEGITEVNLSELDSEAGDNNQNVSGLLNASDDIFTKTAAYTFGPMFFRTRGYDSDYESVYMNGVMVNDAETGRAVWSEWGGLNDVTRNRVSVENLAPSSFAFGSLGGSTNIITRASKQRKQLKATFSHSNKTYQFREMLTYSTGLIDDKWAFTLSGSRRHGNGGYVEGTFYDAWGYFIGIERKINEQHSLGLTVYGAPTKRGMQAAATQEAYNLTGTNYYNPNWGYQNGAKRNAKVKSYHEPMFILNHYWTINPETELNTAISYTIGKNGTSALNWYNSADPRPDYYRYLPSYAEQDENPDPTLVNDITNAWINDPARSQIKWDDLYQINYLNNMEGRGSSYIVEEYHIDQNQLAVTSTLNREINEHINLDGGIEFRKYQGKHFKVIDDLLGGQYWLDVDQYAERDFPNDPNSMQNDLNNPNRKVGVGDKFGYNFDINLYSGTLWAQPKFSYNKTDFFFAGHFTYTTFWRDGKMKNGRHPDNSFGKSASQSFNDFGIKGGLTYKFPRRHFLQVMAGYLTRPPLIRNSYISPKTRDDVVPDIQSEQILSGEISYIYNHPNLKTRLTLFQTYFYNQVEINSFYHDEYQTLVNHVMTGINRSHRGLELGIEGKLIPSLTAYGVLAYGNYRYINHPDATITFDNGSKPDTNEIIYCKNFFVSGTPQTATAVGLNYTAPKYWYFNLNINYFDRIYLDFNPERRSSAAIENLIPEEQPLIAAISRQQKLNDGFTVDASVGKSIKINKVFININFSVSNIFNNKEIITGGYEQLRFDFAGKNIDKFPPKYYYAFGRTYFLNIGIRI